MLKNQHFILQTKFELQSFLAPKTVMKPNNPFLSASEHEEVSRECAAELPCMLNVYVQIPLQFSSPRLCLCSNVNLEDASTSAGVPLEWPRMTFSWSPPGTRQGKDCQATLPVYGPLSGLGKTCFNPSLTPVKGNPEQVCLNAATNHQQFSGDAASNTSHYSR